MTLTERLIVLPKNEQLAWVAGLFEGEGTCFTYKRKGPKGDYNYPRLSVKMLDSEPLEAVKEILGKGKLYSSPYFRNSEKLVWNFSVTNTKDVEDILTMIYPYFTNRRKEQVEKVIALCNDGEAWW